jgi:hypothetical protein
MSSASRLAVQHASRLPRLQHRARAAVDDQAVRVPSHRAAYPDPRGNTKRQDLLRLVGGVLVRGFISFRLRREFI